MHGDWFQNYILLYLLPYSMAYLSCPDMLTLCSSELVIGTIAFPTYWGFINVVKTVSRLRFYPIVTICDSQYLITISSYLFSAFLSGIGRGLHTIVHTIVPI